MRKDAVGEVVHEATMRVEPVKLAELTAAIGTESASETARIVPWFGVTIGGDQRLVDTLDMDLSRALLAGHRYDWHRPVEPGEEIQARVTVDQVFSKGDNDFAVLTTEFRDAANELVQTQTTTFIERGVA